MLRLCIIFSLALLTLACEHNHNTSVEIDNHEHGNNSITIYSKKLEIFMEYPSLQVGYEVQFLIHLTETANFKPVREGKLLLNFINRNNDDLIVELESPFRAGIYSPSVKFDKPGNYTMTLTINGNQISDEVSIPNIKVYSEHSQMPHQPEEDKQGITFLKEQQWKIEFANSLVTTKMMQDFISSTGEIQAKPELYSNVVSPIQGIVLAKNNSGLKTLGSYVKQGEHLLKISPSADATENIQKIQNDFLLSQSEYKRVSSLYNKGLTTQKHLDEIRSDFETKQASYNSLSNQIVIDENGYSVISPIDGYIENIHFNLGDHLDSGQELFTIVNPSRLILKSNVQSSHFEVASKITDACFKPEGYSSEFTISNLNGKRLAIATSLDLTNRTLPVYFEFDNPGQVLKIGMFTQVHLRTGPPMNLIAIPISAIVNEDGLKTAYVQLEGELFEKRILKTGISDDGYIQIIDGIKEGERVVTKGAYQIRLAGISPDSEIGHGHVH